MSADQVEAASSSATLLACHTPHLPYASSAIRLTYHTPTPHLPLLSPSSPARPPRPLTPHRLTTPHQIEAAFANASCLSAMLSSNKPQRFDASCGAALPDDALGRERAKQPLEYATLYCKHTPRTSSPSSPSSSNTEGKLAPTGAPRAASAPRPPLPPGTTLCKRRRFGEYIHGEGRDEQRQPKSPAMKETPRGDTACTPAELRLCERATAHSHQQTGALGAELCMLRRPRAGLVPAVEILPLLVRA